MGERPTEPPEEPEEKTSILEAYIVERSKITSNISEAEEKTEELSGNLVSLRGRLNNLQRQALEEVATSETLTDAEKIGWLYALNYAHGEDISNENVAELVQHGTSKFQEIEAVLRTKGAPILTFGRRLVGEGLRLNVASGEGLKIEFGDRHWHIKIEIQAEPRDGWFSLRFLGPEAIGDLLDTASNAETAEALEKNLRLRSELPEEDRKDEYLFMGAEAVVTLIDRVMAQPPHAYSKNIILREIYLAAKEKGVSSILEHEGMVSWLESFRHEMARTIGGRLLHDIDWQSADIARLVAGEGREGNPLLAEELGITPEMINDAAIAINEERHQAAEAKLVKRKPQ